MYDLKRFKDAQEQSRAGFQSALSEIKAGYKRSHWIWYIFPQISGLGSSGMARAYALVDPGEATAYLQDRELRSRLLAITSAAAEHLRRGVPLERMMGSDIDALKLVSSLTLFGELARRLSASEHLPEYEALAKASQEI